MTSHTPEVVSVWPRTTPYEPQTPASMSMIGYVGKSRYDVDVALQAAMAAVVVGLHQLNLRLSYNLAECQTHFNSEQDATRWTRGHVRVVIISAYTAMVDLTRDAVHYVQMGRLERSDLAMLANMTFDDFNRLEISCASADAVQGETFDYVVLALPPLTSQWSD